MFDASSKVKMHIEPFKAKLLGYIENLLITDSTKCLTLIFHAE